MLNILSSGSRVKFFKTRNRLEAARAEAAPPEIVDNMPVYRVICRDCGWTWKSEHLAQEPRPARTQAQAHTDAYGHQTQTVFDIIGQEDETFRPRSAS